MRPTTDQFDALYAQDQIHAQDPYRDYDAGHVLQAQHVRRDPELRRKARLAASAIVLCFSGFIGVKLMIGAPAPAPQITAAADPKADARALEQKAVDPLPVATTAPAGKPATARLADKGPDKTSAGKPAAKPAVAKIEAKSVEAKSVETKPVAQKIVKPAGAAPVAARPIELKPSEQKASGAKSTESKPADQKPARAKSVSAEDALALSHMALLDPNLSLSARPEAFGSSAPLSSNLTPPAPLPALALSEVVANLPSKTAMLEPVLPPIRPAALGAAPAQTTAQTAATEPAIPMPPPRPAAFAVVQPARPAAFASAQPQMPIRAPAGKLARLRPTTPPQAPADGRGFFEKLFAGAGADPAGPSSTMAYAAPQENATRSFGGIGSSLGSSTTAGDDRFTAVYDIAAQKVYLPNGSTLEAHSGLGAKMDDPRHVHVRMNGATPPSLYDLREREALFHGVRAIRLLPVGGPGAIHGRSGILAHTYMLGPNGQSNGCVSFRNYDAFLQAYLRGDVKRLRVVAGRSSRFAFN